MEHLMGDMKILVKSVAKRITPKALTEEAACYIIHGYVFFSLPVIESLPSVSLEICYLGELFNFKKCASKCN